MESVSLKSQNPLFLACQVFGVLPWDRNLHSSTFGLFYSVAVNLLVCVCVCYIKISQGFWDTKLTSVDFTVKLMIVIRELSDLLIIGAHAFSLLFRRNTLEKVISGVKFLEPPTASGKTTTKLFYVIFITCYWITMSTASNLCPPLLFHSQANSIGLELPYIISFLAAASFSTLIGYLRSQLDQMTGTLQPNEKTLSLQLDLSLFILDLSRTINKFYSIQIFLLCCRLLINLILSGYFIVDCFMNKSLFTPSDVFWINYLVYIALLAGFAGDLSVLISICSSCTNFQNAVERFNDRLFSLMRENNHLSNNDKLYLYVTIKQRVQFTACGFYSLGYPLVTSIIATASTQLVILFQFTSHE